MNITEERRQEALLLLQRFNETQWRMIMDMSEMMSRKPTKEENEALEKLQQELREKREKAREKEKALQANAEAAFTTWKQKHIKGVQIPIRYDLACDEMQNLMEYATRRNPDGESILNSLYAMFKYGFKRGSAYIENTAKRKASLHAANTKKGLERSTDEI